ncbi:hypothetical protein C8R46DRAFT_1101672 [Mycena filopes]|nr:hypothetical protein C8R46DRAFT_1101672 [Mycena filopes]
MTTISYPPPPGPPPAMHTGVQYAPPPGRPPQMYAPPPAAPPLPSCQDTTELAAYVRNSLAVLASQGWLSVPLPPDLESLYAELFAQSASFFELPPDAPAKVDYAAPTGKAASDEGFADIPGEKQLITLRRLSGTPPPLRKSATEAWDATGQVFLRAMHDIAESLELADESIFDAMAAEAQGFSPRTRASSLLRLFRYNRPTEGGAKKKVVAEAHKDLGLLTLVVGHSPGLDVRDPVSGRWVSVEDTPAGGTGQRLTATLLAGQTLTYLTRGLYASGAHRVSVLPPSSPSDQFRFSLVFALRPAPDALISTPLFEASPLIGKFPEARLSAEANNYPECSMYEQSAGELFRCIAQKHWNVNIAPEIREEQKRKLLGEKPGEEKGVEEERLG